MDERHTHAAGGPLDLRRTERSLGSAVKGYGLTPSAARERAAVVRAVTQDPGIRQRPMPVVVVTGLVALVALVVWGWQLYVAITDEQPLTTLFWAALATSLVASAICSWAWQLYDVQKAIVMWFAMAVLGIAAVLIIVLVLVALKGGADDIDFDLGDLIDKITGPAGSSHGTGAVDTMAPLVLDTFEGVAQGIGGGDEPTVEPEPEAVPSETRDEVANGPACPGCDRPITAGLLICPRCGARTG